jgi:hypothetical protein
MTQSNRTRSLALVGLLAGERRVTQTAGFPIDPSQVLPAPDVILLIAGDDPGAMVFRYTAHWTFAGDTWHASVASAREQAVDEYDDALGVWVDVPPEVQDAHAYAVQYAAERLNSRGDW